MIPIDPNEITDLVLASEEGQLVDGAGKRPPCPPQKSKG